MTAKRWPVIGIVTRAVALAGRTDCFQGVYSSYIDCIHAAGGVPLLLPFVSGAAIDRLDGLVLAGGEDLAQASWWSDGGPHTPVDTRRDTAEQAISLSARETNLPTLAICRGAQVVNCALGGMVARFDEGGAVGHIASDDGSSCEHRVIVAPETALGAALGGEKSIRVVSRHSSFIAKLGSGLRSAAIAEDGTVEAFVSTEWACLGLQWHPECRGTAVERDLRPFEWLVAQARRRMKS